MDNDDYPKIRARSFLWCCCKQAIRGSWERADTLSVLAGLIFGAIAYFIPAVEEKVTHSLLIVPLVSLASVTIVRVLISPLLVYREREKEAHNTEKRLRQTITAHEETIRSLQPPERTPAEQYEYDHAKNVISKASPKAASVLRFVYRHGAQIFGLYDPAQLPDGITGAEMRGILDGWARDGLVSRRDIQEPRNPHSVYDIAASMKPILNQLLYDQN